jgi:hypothetical protein
VKGLSVTEEQRRWETQKWRECEVTWWPHDIVSEGTGLRCCDIRRCGLVVLITVVEAVCTIMGKQSEGTLV